MPGVAVVTGRWRGHRQLWCQLFHLSVAKLTIFNGYDEISEMFRHGVFNEASQAEENNDGTGREDAREERRGRSGEWISMGFSHNCRGSSTCN